MDIKTAALLMMSSNATEAKAQYLYASQNNKTYEVSEFEKQQGICGYAPISVSTRRLASISINQNGIYDIKDTSQYTNGYWGYIYANVYVPKDLSGLDSFEADNNGVYNAYDNNLIGFNLFSVTGAECRLAEYLGEQYNFYTSSELNGMSVNDVLSHLKYGDLVSHAVDGVIINQNNRVGITWFTGISRDDNGKEHTNFYLRIYKVSNNASPYKEYTIPDINASGAENLIIDSIETNGMKCTITLKGYLIVETIGNEITSASLDLKAFNHTFTVDASDIVDVYGNQLVTTPFSNEWIFTR